MLCGIVLCRFVLGCTSLCCDVFGRVVVLYCCVLGRVVLSVFCRLDFCLRNGDL